MDLILQMAKLTITQGVSGLDNNSSCGQVPQQKYMLMLATLYKIMLLSEGTSQKGSAFL
jgi:hypothetical protein